MKRQPDDGHLQVKERGVRENQLCRHLDLGLPVSKTVRNKLLLFSLSSLWYLVI